MAICTIKKRCRAMTLPKGKERSHRCRLCHTTGSIYCHIHQNKESRAGTVKASGKSVRKSSRKSVRKSSRKSVRKSVRKWVRPAGTPLSQLPHIKARLNPEFHENVPIDPTYSNILVPVQRERTPTPFWKKEQYPGIARKQRSIRSRSVSQVSADWYRTPRPSMLRQGKMWHREGDRPLSGRHMKEKLNVEFAENVPRSPRLSGILMRVPSSQRGSRRNRRK